MRVALAFPIAIDLIIKLIAMGTPRALAMQHEYMPHAYGSHNFILQCLQVLDVPNVSYIQMAVSEEGMMSCLRTWESLFLSPVPTGKIRPLVLTFHGVGHLPPPFAT